MYAHQPNAMGPQSYDPTDYNGHHDDFASRPVDYKRNPSDYNAHPAYAQHQQLDYGHGQPNYAQPAYRERTYADNSTTDPNTYEQGYAQREGAPAVTPSLPSKPRRNWFGFMSSKWAAMFMAITAIQAVVCLCFEAYVYSPVDFLFYSWCVC